MLEKVVLGLQAQEHYHWLRFGSIILKLGQVIAGSEQYGNSPHSAQRGGHGLSHQSNWLTSLSWPNSNLVISICLPKRKSCAFKWIQLQHLLPVLNSSALLDSCCVPVQSWLYCSSGWSDIFTGVENTLRQNTQVWRRDTDVMLWILDACRHGETLKACFLIIQYILHSAQNYCGTHCHKIS